MPHSPNVAYSDDDSQVLWHDGERVLRDDHDQRRSALIIRAAADHPSRSSLDELDGSWAVRPLDLVRDAARSRAARRPHPRAARRLSFCDIG
jgi:hypothetical protein